MKMLDKHKSKLHKGFIKQSARQNLKKDFVKIVIKPIILSYNSGKGKYTPLKRKFWNNKWNGMHLHNLTNDFNQSQPNWMYSKFRINKEGNYTLSMHGKSILRKKKLKRDLK